ncbi:hypothetical protein SADUNF_Sadunf12G0060000 [Salix dunnii]|uniref:Uncharacterized protein n=1 Tax=Salix dunnii TaxID=1413687 RepID=A0A835MVZ2_9ROSI|nr:hypothetical protein SADUNF_Sadunf12G0060000 [Salix dunnii]
MRKLLAMVLLLLFHFLLDLAKALQTPPVIIGARISGCDFFRNTELMALDIGGLYQKILVANVDKFGVAKDDFGVVVFDTSFSTKVRKDVDIAKWARQRLFKQ